VVEDDYQKEVGGDNEEVVEAEIEKIEADKEEDSEEELWVHFVE